MHGVERSLKFRVSIGDSAAVSYLVGSYCVYCKMLTAFLCMVGYKSKDNSDTTTTLLTITYCYYNYNI